MNPQTLLNKPQTSPRVVSRITKISSLVETSNKARKASTSLRKVFEKGTYQKKTQLSILNRYKKRLDSIHKQNDKNLLKKKRTKLKLPEIKKYAGNFFTPGSANDPLKAIGALAAFNTAKKVANKDYLGAIGPALVAAGIFLGPALLRGGVNAMRRGGGAEMTPSITSGGGLFRGTPYSQTRAGQSYAGMQAQRNLPGWAQRAAGGSASRFAASNERLIQGTANIGDRSRVLARRFGFEGIGGMAENIATRGGGRAAGNISARTGGTIAAKAAGVGSRAIPLLGTAVNLGLSAYRFSQGDVVGGILSAVSAIPIIGWAALGVDLAREFGAFDGTILGRKDSLQQLTEEQKKAVEDKKKQEQGGLTFGKTLNRYEKVVDKFEKFSKDFKGGMGMNKKQMQQQARRVEDLGGGSDPISSPGHEFTSHPTFAQYLTGDPTSPAYDPAHGGSNYHEHLAFKDRDTARRAYEFLKSKGLKVTEFGVSGGHSPGSAHYDGRAFDVPADQVPVGKERELSARVRAYMNDFYNMQSSSSGNPNVFNLELHHPGANERQRSGLIENMLVGPQGNVVTQAFKSSFDSYKRGFRDLGGPKRGLNLLEMANELGVDANAQKIVDIMKRHPNYQFNLFAGHTDVPTGDPGGSGAEGEQVFVTKVANRVMQLATAAGLRNVKYYPATARVGGNDPRANWNVAQRLWQAGQRSGRQPLTSQQVASSLRQAPPRTIGPRPQQSITIPVPIPQPQQQVVSSGGGGGMMMMPGPSQQQLLNSFYRRVLLNTI